jgi:UDP-N-acetylglucosamine 2-epimerase
MQTILRAVDDAKLEALCIYPNSDRGSSGIIEAIEAHAQNGRLASGFRTARSLDRDEYLRRLIGADLLIGNSSSGIIEAATAGTPAVDIGPRQHGRETSGRSVIHAEESYAAVRAAIKRALRLGPINASRSAYGDGRAGERIAQLLIRVPVTEAYRRKLNSY